MKRNSFFSNFSVYFLSSVFGACISFVCTPLLTKLLSLDNIGRIELYNSIFNILLNISLFGSTTFLVKHFYQDEKTVGQMMRHIILFNFLTSLFLCSIYLLIDLHLANTHLYLNNIIFILYLTVIFAALKTVFMTYLQLKEKAKEYALINGIECFFEWVLTFFFLLSSNLDHYSRLIAICVSNGGVLIYLICKYNFLNFKHIEIKLLKEIFLFGVPFLLSTVSSWIMEMIDKIFIVGLLDLESNAIYSIGYKFGMIIMMIEVAFSKAWSPYFFKEISNINNDILKKIIFFSILFFMGVCIYIPVAIYALFLLYPKEYFEAIRVIVIISFAYFFDFLWKIINPYLIHFNRIYIYNFSLIFAGLMNIILNFVLIRKFGLSGAALATLFSFMSGFIFSLFCLLRVKRNEN